MHPHEYNYVVILSCWCRELFKVVCLILSVCALLISTKYSSTQPEAVFKLVYFVDCIVNPLACERFSRTSTNCGFLSIGPFTLPCLPLMFHFGNRIVTFYKTLMVVVW